MKPHSTSCRIFATSLSIAAFCLLASLAYGEDSNKGKAASEKKPAKKQRVAVTGSNIPEKKERVQRHIPTTVSPTVIITRDEIDRLGRPTVVGVLAQQPTIR
jgi:outer membrane cobalamin receptor